jgi:hypothetical protein
MLRNDLWILRGEEIATKKEITIIYTGSEENRNFLIKLAFDKYYTENHIGKTWLWEIFKMAKKRSANWSLMVTELPISFHILFRRKNYFSVPCWISGRVNISPDLSSLINNESLKSDVRKIRRNELDFELINQPPQFHNFYYNMYLPYISKVYTNGAFITEYDSMKKIFRNGDLLLIKRAGEYIAGILLGYSENEASLCFLGVKDGNSNYIKEGAIGALYYFSVSYLRGKGYQWINVGRSRAFFKDGVLKYKKKWGLQLIDPSETGFLIKPLSKTPGVKGFFLNNPFIYMDRMGLCGAIFVETDEFLSEKELTKIYKDYYLMGIDKLVVYRFGEGDSGIQHNVTSDFLNIIAVCPAESYW